MDGDRLRIRLRRERRDRKIEGKDKIRWEGWKDRWMEAVEKIKKGKEKWEEGGSNGGREAEDKMKKGKENGERKIGEG